MKTISRPLPCPFCGKRIQATAEPLGVLHDLPYCQVFEETEDALDFLKRCNAEKAKNLS